MFRIEKSAVELKGTYRPVVAAKGGPAAPDEKIIDHEALLEQKEQESARRAERILADARAEAEAILAKARADAEAAMQSAVNAGREQGANEAALRQKQFEAEIKAQFQGFLAVLHEKTDIIGGRMEDDILLLSLAIAEKIVNMELEKDDIMFRRLVKDAVERVNARERFVIHLNHREYHRFFADGAGWLEDTARTEPFTVVDDPDVPPGGCVIKSVSGMVNAGISAQIAKIAQAVGLSDGGQAQP